MAILHGQFTSDPEFRYRDCEMEFERSDESDLLFVAVSSLI